MIARTCFVIVTLLTAVTSVVPAAEAQVYPTKPIRMLVGFPPGGTSDIVARALGDRLTLALGQQIVVDNRAGASGNIVAELVVLAKARPGERNFASSGLGTPAHLAGELFKQVTGANVVHVPYKGTAPALVDLVAGRVQLYFTSFPGALTHVQGGRLRAIAVTRGARSGILPQVPTLTEAGVPGYQAGSWYGVSLPARTPREVVERLQAEIQRALRDAGLTARLTDQGLDAVPGVTPGEFARFVREERQRWARVIERAGMLAR